MALWYLVVLIFACCFQYYRQYSDTKIVFFIRVELAFSKGFHFSYSIHLRFGTWSFSINFSDPLIFVKYGQWIIRVLHYLLLHLMNFDASCWEWSLIDLCVLIFVCFSLRAYFNLDLGLALTFYSSCVHCVRLIRYFSD